jgi:putative membrane protein
MKEEVKSQHRRLFGVYLRGIAMGAADVVPGVSGGTVAFVTGIYEELLNSIRSVNPAALLILIRAGLKPFWQSINGSFLLALLLGILTSILSLARIISYLLDAHPLLLWSFFFGLIAASSLYMLKQIKQFSWFIVIAILIGAVFAYGVAEIKPSEMSPEPLWVFIAGSIAICAMILPGISGSFLLVLMGMYGHILTAIKEFQWLLLMSFAAGCGVGLLGFSHLLSWLFKRFHDATVALLTGFLVGSLNLVWPWKETLSYYQNSHGESLALEQRNVLPSTYDAFQGQESNGLACLFLIVLGFLLIFGLEKLSSTKKYH